MDTMTLVDVATGETLDTIGIDDDGTPVCVTGEAEAVLAALAEAYAQRGVEPLSMVDELDGWTDGRVTLEAAPVVLADDWTPPLPEALLDLREAGRDRKLRKYWTRGKGALKIRWGVGGDFKRCVRHLGKYVNDPEGLCNTYHQTALGAPPGKGH